MKHQRNYTIGSRALQIVIIIGLIANLIVWGIVAYRELTKPAPETVPMANQNVVWDGAGYNGYWARGGN